MIKAIFFDIGDVILDEDLQHRFMFHTILSVLRAHGKPVMWDEYDATRRRLAAAGPDPEAAIEGSLAYYCEGSDETDILWHEAREIYEEMRKPRPYGLLLDGITAVFQDLRKDFRLGIIANQHPPVAQAIDDYGIGALFDTIVVSEIVGLFKPHPDIFSFALNELQIEPAEAIFVGDRPDNDVKPAKALGMGTVRFKRGGQYTHFNPADPAMTADRVVTHVEGLAEGVRQVAAKETIGR